MLVTVACVDHPISPPAEDGWEQFRRDHRLVEAGEASEGAFLVEGDMVVDEETLRHFYVGTAPPRLADVAAEPLLVDAPFGPASIRSNPIPYCFTENWGAPNGNPVDGFYTAPPLGPVQENIERAMQIWSGVTNVRFIHRADLDGSACSVWRRYAGEIEFWISHYPHPTTATGAFPSATNEFQQLRVPTSGISVPLAVHEIGHILGFRHEHEREEADDPGPVPDGGAARVRCPNSLNAIAQTPFDPWSVMIYQNCTVSAAIVGFQAPSTQDRIGARALYGNPAWWASGI